MRLRCFVLFLLLMLGATAQVPALTVGVNPDRTQVQRFRLINTYGAPATEWVLAISFGIPGGGPCSAALDDSGSCTRTVIRHSWGLPAVGHQVPIPVGGSLPVGAPVGSRIVNTAVIYADGATAGDPATVQAVLAARQRMLDDLRQAVPLLAAAAADPKTDYGRLAATFQSRTAKHRTVAIAAFHEAGNAGAPPATAGDRVDDPIAHDILTNLKSMSASRLALHEAQLAKFYQGWIVQLEQSKPALH